MQAITRSDMKGLQIIHDLFCSNLKYCKFVTSAINSKRSLFTLIRNKGIRFLHGIVSLLPYLPVGFYFIHVIEIVLLKDFFMLTSSIKNVYEHTINRFIIKLFFL